MRFMKYWQEEVCECAQSRLLLFPPPLCVASPAPPWPQGKPCLSPTGLSLPVPTAPACLVRATQTTGKNHAVGISQCRRHRTSPEVCVPGAVPLLMFDTQ